MVKASPVPFCWLLAFNDRIIDEGYRAIYLGPMTIPQSRTFNGTLSSSTWSMLVLHSFINSFVFAHRTFRIYTLSSAIDARISYNPTSHLPLPCITYADVLGFMHCSKDSTSIGRSGLYQLQVEALRSTLVFSVQNLG